MKKYLLTTLVIGAFLINSWIVRMKAAASADPIPTDPNPSSNPSPSSNPNPSPLTGLNSSPASGYKDGTYTGSVADAFYGNVQVAAVIQHSTLIKVNILQYPNDRSHSIEINSQALPLLQSEAIQAQNARVDIVSGATDTSQAFMASLNTALQLAQH